MFTQMSRMLVMLVTLLGVLLPPSRSPGSNPQKAGSPPDDAPAAPPCPFDCEGAGMWQKDYLYVCDECHKDSYYCTDCKRSYSYGERDHNQHNGATG